MRTRSPRRISLAHLLRSILVATGTLVVASTVTVVPGVPATVVAQEAAGPRPLWGGELVERIDSLAAAVLEDGPVASLAIGVKRGDRLLLARGYGMADIENQVAAGPETVYRIGSITKQFTAAAIMQLVEAGKIGLDDSMTRYLPDFPTQGHDVTIRHLLTHTSGIRSYTSLEEWRPKMRLDLTDEELVALFSDEPFDFAPGEQYAYSNSAYYLLGMIVGEVTGEPYPEYVESHLFEPLGLAGSRYCDERRIIPRRAEGYAVADGRLVNDEFLSMNQPGAGGGLCSTVLDLLSWTTALRDGVVVSPASYERMTTPYTLKDGSRTEYGFGLEIRELEGHPGVAHGGGIPGFSTMLAHYPEADLDVVVLTNTESPESMTVADVIARWALGVEVPTVVDLPLSAGERAVYEGVYEIREGLELEVYSEGDELMSRATGQGSFGLRHQGNHGFVAAFDDQVRLVFTVKDGRATGLVLRQGGQTFEAERVR